MSDLCQHNYCPHLHFKKCRRQRERNIPYTSRPTKQIQLSCNVHPKMLNLSTRNIPTLAYEQYSINQVVPAQEQMNFSKNFYLENCPQHSQLRNTLVSDMQESMGERNAYVLAIGATKQYSIFSKTRQDYLDNARKRAKISYHNYFESKKQQMLKLKEDQKKWVINYYRKVEELIDHMFGHQNQNIDPNLQDKLFIKENESKTVKFLGGLKVSNPTVALQILQSLRAILLKKKMALEEERKDQQHNKSVSASCTDGSVSQDVSQGTSFMSAATNDATQQGGEEHFAEQFCNFQLLQKRWGVKDVTQIRNIIRRLVSRTMITNAEGQEMRQKKAAKDKKDLLRKQMAELGHSVDEPIKKNVKKESKIGKKNKQSSKKKIEPNKKEIKEQVQPFFRDSLNSQQQKVKTVILKGGQFDAVGDKYERNRNYSLLFKKRRQESQFELSFRQEKEYYIPKTTRR